MKIVSVCDLLKRFGVTSERRRGTAAWMMAALLLLTGPALLCSAGEDPPGDPPEGGAPEVDDDPTYVIESFDVSYYKPHPQLPPVAELMALEVQLGMIGDAFVSPRPGVTLTSFRISETPGLATHKFRASALAVIDQAITEHMKAQQLMSIYVAPHWQDISQDLSDIRPAGSKKMRIVVYIGVLTQLRTVGSGARVPDTDRYNNPIHARILANSPVKPEEGMNLLRRDLLDDYVAGLNRHPGRRVDMALASTGETGSVSLDYLINEPKPWMAYYQIENTGTHTTARDRHRFGFIHNQLSGADDILSLEFATAGFDEANSYTLSYQRPLFGSDKIDWRVYAACSNFEALDIGPTNEDVEGDGWLVGAEIIANIYQKNSLFVDAVAGVTFRHVFAQNKTLNILNIQGRDDLLLPHIGVRFERITPLASTRGDITIEWTESRIMRASQRQLDNLGRFQPDREWTTLDWDFEHSFFLEPVLGGEDWMDPGTPEDPNPHATLAHEVAVMFRGQYAFGGRLIPQYQFVLGGFHSVRGYEESVVAGDTAWVGTLEYRYHIPRGLKPSPNPVKIPLFGSPMVFRLRPQQPYGRPDWDLIFRAFFDMGETYQMARRSYESNETLIGTGIGLELQILQNLTARADWGFALKDADDGETDSGDSRVHLSLTLIF